MTNEEKVSLKGLFSDVVFLALLTAGAYWLAFRYEAGYLSAFGLPPHIIQVKLESMLVAALAVSGAVWTIFWLGNLVAMSWPNDHALQKKVLRVALMLLFPLWHLLNYGLRKEDWIFYLIILIILSIILVFEIIWPIMVFRDKTSLKDKFIADEIAESKTRERGLFGRILVFLGPVAYVLLLLFVIGTWLAHSAGKAEAVTKEEYMVLTEQPSIAIIRIYPDLIYRNAF